MSHLFKPGDRVRAIGDVDGLDLTGKIGTLIQYQEGEFSDWVGVVFDEDFDNSHNLNGLSPIGRGRRGPESCFELLNDSIGGR